MNNYTQRDFVRINKTVAKRYLDGMSYDVIIVGRFVSPHSRSMAFHINGSELMEKYGNFEKFLNNWYYYNANSITGMYPAFYVTYETERAYLRDKKGGRK